MKIVRNTSAYLKYLLFLITILTLCLVFPQQSSFQYEYQLHTYWQYNDLIAPFDFAILKSKDTLEAEKKEITTNAKVFFRLRNSENPREKLQSQLKQEFNKDKYVSFGLKIWDSLAHAGIIASTPLIEGKSPDYVLMLVENDRAVERMLGSFFTLSSAQEFISNQSHALPLAESKKLIHVLSENLLQNAVLDNNLTQSNLQKQLSEISPSIGMISIGQRIISKGEIITEEKKLIIDSFRKEYLEQMSYSKKYFISIGQFIIITLSFALLGLFLAKARPKVWGSKKDILAIILLIVLTSTLVAFVARNFPEYKFMIPFCIMPITLRVVFDRRTAAISLVVTLIMNALLIPNNYEYSLFQLIVGILSIYSINQVQSRTQIFATSIFIFLTYVILFTGVFLLTNRPLSELSFKPYVLFAGNAFLVLLSYPLIYLYEKIFGYVTEVSLLELSNTNSKLLRMLSLKAPGTFQHSIQVANIAEDVIYKIGGNSLLARVGGLYHDIGKMENPIFFVENQNSKINPHNEILPVESAEIIISHVINGIEIARKYKLPEQIIDFIRTHHGTKKTEFFYYKQQQEFPNEPIDESVFTYHGPKPYSRETAVLMMVDSVEAASRSLKEYSEESIADLVDRIINQQLAQGQFANSDITLRDIECAKQILKTKLMNVYHVRISYPDMI